MGTLQLAKPERQRHHGAVMPTPTASSPMTPKNPREVLLCRDAATGEHLGEVAIMDQEQVDAAVARARKAQANWAETSFNERRKVFRDLLKRILAEQQTICRAACRDSGKTPVDAAMGEVFPVCEKLRYTIRNGERDLRPSPRRSGFLLHKSARVEYSPLGVIGVIAPWNFPFHNLLCPLIPALFAGNAVVTKVSELATWSSLGYLDLLRDVLRARGHDPELVQIVTGYGPAGQALIRSGVEKIFFTGSPENGRRVMATAAESLTPVVLELGGKDPMIICDDANIDQAADAAMLGVFTACGQMCVGAERIYVFDSVYDQFIERVLARVVALRQGPPLTGEYDVGAMTMPRQIEIIQSLVDDAIAKGARLLTGGRRNENLSQGSYYEPTILVDVDHSMRITQEEQFGPVMVIVRVADEQEAIQLANDCPYGLGSSIFTRDRKRSDRIAAKLDAGMTVVNDYGLAYMIQDLPFGGVKISGIGKINGREGLRACCNAKAVVRDRIPVRQGLAVYPVRETTEALLNETIRMIYSRGLLVRTKAVGRALRAFVALARARRR
ncbi:MAG TPA: aldehyde dehydrogenase family protein [Nannocystis exedens]|nr:aldehyde dehydrogenase family protein [Nannocystis exedens]